MDQIRIKSKSYEMSTMSNGTLQVEDDFKLITHKRSKRTQRNLPLHFPCATNSAISEERALRRVQEAQLELNSSDVLASALASLREALAALENPQIKEIICFGLGRIGECTTSRFQFAFLLYLKEQYDVVVKAYDPVFSETDRWLLSQFNCLVLDKNSEGKYSADNSSTIFYLPHCPKQLSNNLLWANWGLSLHKCVIIANSFNTIVERTSTRILSKNAEYILNISPHVLEFAVINSFKYHEIFNDTAIHVFPLPKLRLLSEDFWCFCSEPNYSDEDLEFIKHKSETAM